MRRDLVKYTQWTQNALPGLGVCLLLSLCVCEKYISTLVTLADSQSEGSDIDAEYSSYLEDENNNELVDSASDYDVTDPLANTQGIRESCVRRRILES